MHQEILLSQLKLLFPHEKTYVNTKRIAFEKQSESNVIFELDIWIPAYNLSFEFQDAHHYVHTWYSQKSLESIQSKDHIKKHVVYKKGITLIEVPCWWDGGLESLAATICFHRPDVISSSNIPIHLNPNLGLFKEAEVPVIGELMRASFPVNNVLFIDSNSWWLGEKYDGIRMCWNSLARKVYSRTGVEIQLPSNFVKLLPKLTVEGEFWFGRANFYDAMSLIQNEPEDISWHLLRLIAFDVPLKILYGLSFEERYHLLLALVTHGHAFSTVVHRVMVQTNAQLEWTIKEIIGDGGEGVMLRKVGSKYEPGRSSSLYKLKTPYGDTEAIVVGYGDQNSVHLRLPNGTIFTVPPRHVQTTTYPAIGDVVTFSYEMHVRTEVPASPKITRIRTDVSWEDVEKDYVEESRFIQKQMKDVAEMNYRKIDKQNAKSDNTAGMWNSVESRRAFFEKYAKENGFNPRVADNWFGLTKVKLLKETGAKQLLLHHKKSLRRALCDLFPDIGLEKNQLKTSWQDPKRRRKFLEEFAHSNGFNPLKAENWYWQTSPLVKFIKGGQRVLAYHEGSVNKAVADLFPEIGFDLSRAVQYARENPQPFAK